MDKYIEKDFRLEWVIELAKKMYEQANLPLHNHSHGLWVAEKATLIGEKEGEVDISALISAALLHDAGVAEGAYTGHAATGAKIARRELPDLGFVYENTERIALAIEQHSGFNHTSNESRYLYDADTLNKAGKHGIEQCRLACEEFGFSIDDAAKRYIPLFFKLNSKGYYTKTAEEIDVEMGVCGFGGLKLGLEYWKKINEILKKGNVKETEILLMAKSYLGI